MTRHGNFDDRFTSASLNSGSENVAFAGVDRHKSFCQAIVGTHEGKVLKEGRIPPEKEDMVAFFSGLER